MDISWVTPKWMWCTSHTRHPELNRIWSTWRHATSHCLWQPAGDCQKNQRNGSPIHRSHSRYGNFDFETLQTLKMRLPTSHRCPFVRSSAFNLCPTSQLKSLKLHLSRSILPSPHPPEPIHSRINQSGEKTQAILLRFNSSTTCPHD